MNGILNGLCDKATGICLVGVASMSDPFSDEGNGFDNGVTLLVESGSELFDRVSGIESTGPCDEIADLHDSVEGWSESEIWTVRGAYFGFLVWIKSRSGKIVSRLDRILGIMSCVR